MHGMVLVHAPMPTGFAPVPGLTLVVTLIDATYHPTPLRPQGLFISLISA